MIVIYKVLASFCRNAENNFQSTSKQHTNVTLKSYMPYKYIEIDLFLFVQMRLAFFRMIFLLVCRVGGERFWFTTSCESGTFSQDLNPLCLPA